MSTDSKPPRVKFCWECGRKLWGNRFVTKVIDGYEKILHKQCAENPDSVVPDWEVLEEKEKGK